MIATRLLGAALAGAVLTGSIQAGAASLTGSYTLNKVTFQGNAQIPTADLQAALPIQPGEKINQAGLQQDVDAVSALYKQRNVGVNITAQPTVFGKTRLDIAYIMAEQAPVAPTVRHVGVTADTVSAVGNSKVSTADILAAANIKPGQVVTQPEITAAQAAILALYKKANVGLTLTIDWTNVSPQHIAMVFKITEKDDG